jgi:hypothetical protein
MSGRRHFVAAEQFEFPLRQGEFPFSSDPAIYCNPSRCPVLRSFCLWTVLRIETIRRVVTARELGLSAFVRKVVG